MNFGEEEGWWLGCTSCVSVSATPNEWSIRTRTGWCNESFVNRSTL